MPGFLTASSVVQNNTGQARRIPPHNPQGHAFHPLVCGELGSGCHCALPPASPREPVVDGPLVAVQSLSLQLGSGSE